MNSLIKHETTTMNNPYQTPKKKLSQSDQKRLLSNGQFWLKITGLVILALLFLPALFYGLCFLVLSTGMNGYEFLLGGFIGLVVAACIAYGFVKLLRWRGDDVGED